MTRISAVVRNWRRPGLLGSGVLCLLAGDPASAFARQAIRDSAGVRIVESAAPRERWTLATQPSVGIGVAEGDTAYLLDDVAASVRLSDGAIVVANCAEPVLRWFGANGAFLHGAGRIGAGPGEFGAGECRRIFRMWRMPGDSVGTWEHAARRLKFFDRSGTFRRDVTLRVDPSAPGTPEIVGQLADGGIIVFIRDPHVRRPVGEMWRDSLTFHHFRPDGSYGGRIARLPGWSFVSWEFQTPRGALVDFTGRPFAPVAASAAHGDHLYYGSADRFEIRVYRRDGALRTIIRRTGSPQRVTSALIAAYRADRTARHTTDEEARSLARMERLLGGREFPETVAAFREIHVDRDGWLWVREYALTGATEVTWSVFDPAGALVAEIEVPIWLRLLEVGRDHVLALGRDALDVEQVRLYRVSRLGARENGPARTRIGDRR